MALRKENNRLQEDRRCVQLVLHVAGIPFAKDWKRMIEGYVNVSYRTLGKAAEAQDSKIYFDDGSRAV